MCSDKLIDLTLWKRNNVTRECCGLQFAQTTTFVALHKKSKERLNKNKNVSQLISEQESHVSRSEIHKLLHCLRINDISFTVYAVYPWTQSATIYAWTRNPDLKIETSRNGNYSFLIF